MKRKVRVLGQSGHTTRMLTIEEVKEEFGHPYWHFADASVAPPQIIPAEEMERRFVVVPDFELWVFPMISGGGMILEG